jgi:hypothetical protein
VSNISKRDEGFNISQKRDEESNIIEEEFNVRKDEDDSIQQLASVRQRLYEPSIYNLNPSVGRPPILPNPTRILKQATGLLPHQLFLPSHQNDINHQIRNDRSTHHNHRPNNRLSSGPSTMYISHSSSELGSAITLGLGTGRDLRLPQNSTQPRPFPSPHFTSLFLDSLSPPFLTSLPPPSPGLISRSSSVTAASNRGSDSTPPIHHPKPAQLPNLSYATFLEWLSGFLECLSPRLGIYAALFIKLGINSKEELDEVKDYDDEMMNEFCDALIKGVRGARLEGMPIMQAKKLISKFKLLRRS